MNVTLIPIALYFPFLYKYSYVITNQYTQLPIIFSFINPEYLSNDWYVSISRVFGPRTIFALYSAVWGQIIGLPLTYFLHYILSIGLTLWASYTLAQLMFNNRKSALLTSITILFGATYSVGGNLLITRDFSVTQLALSLSLVAIIKLIQGKYLHSCVVFTIASYLHPLIGPESITLSFVSLIIYYFINRSERIKLRVKNLIKSCLIYLILVTPLIFLYLNSQSSGISGLWKINILAFARTPHHYLPLSFPLTDYFTFLILIFCAWQVLIFCRKIIPVKISVFYKSFTIISALLMIFSGFSVYLLNFYPGVIIQPFRLTLYIFWFSAIIVYGLIYRGVLTGKLPVLTIFIPLFLSDFRRLISLSKVSALAFFVGLIIIYKFNKIPYKMLLILLIIFFSVYSYHEKFNYNAIFLHPTPETDLANWARTNTAERDIFIIPPEFEKFRLVANRAVVADWKAFPLHESGFLQWLERMCDLGNQKICDAKNLTQDKITIGFRTHTKESLLSLGLKYKAKYAITEVDIPDLIIVYSNYYKIYKIGNYL